MLFRLARRAARQIEKVSLFYPALETSDHYVGFHPGDVSLELGQHLRLLLVQGARHVVVEQAVDGVAGEQPRHKQHFLARVQARDDDAVHIL